MTDQVLKCYRSACDNAADVRMYNRVTQGLYCKKCAIRIDRLAAYVEGPSLFPYLLDARAPEGGAYKAGIVLIRPQD